MRLSRLLIVTFLLALVALSPLHAQSQTGPASPYTVIVPVKDTSEAERNQAFTSGLSQVLVRVAGGQDLRGKSGYDDALKGAAGIVQQYQYQRAGGAAPGVSLQITFDQGAVQRAISTMGVASAGTKPPVLAIVRQGSGGDPLGKDALAPLVQSAAARGYDVIVADGDLPDTAALQKADPAALTTVTQNYKTGLVLIGELHDGGADWTLVSGGRAQPWKAPAAANNDALLADAGNALGDRLGKQLNVVGSEVVDGKLWVSGIGSAMDYADLLAVLRGDPAVRQVTTMEAHGDGMLFQLKADLPLDALAANLAAGGRLLQGDAHDGADASLRWMH